MQPMTPEQQRRAFADRLQIEFDRARRDPVDLAPLCGIPRAYIERWLRGEGMPTAKAIGALAQALNIPPERLSDN